MALARIFSLPFVYITIKDAIMIKITLPSIIHPIIIKLFRLEYILNGHHVSTSSYSPVRLHNACARVCSYRDR